MGIASLTQDKKYFNGQLGLKYRCNLSFLHKLDKLINAMRILSLIAITGVNYLRNLRFLALIIFTLPLIALVAKSLFPQMSLPLNILLFSIVSVQTALETVDAIMKPHAVNLPDKVIPTFSFAVCDAKPEVVEYVGQPIADGNVHRQLYPRSVDMTFPCA